MLRYAETHYKFRLPWSPLSRPLPEMVVDAPWCAVPGRSVPLFLAVHDAHRFPVVLREVRVVVRAGGQMREVRQTLDLRLDRPFHWIPLPWPEPVHLGQNLIDVLFEAEDSKGRRHRFLNHSMPFLPQPSLDVLRLESNFPFPEGWTSGDLHCHTTWSEDPVEWGGDPRVMNDAARCMGMGFWAATDHSYDFAWDHPDWMRPTDPVAKFERFRASFPPDSPDQPLVLPSEEVSCGNSRGRNIHLLLIDHPEYVPGQGDGGRRWLRNKPDLSIPQVLEQAASHGSPAFAAHPRPGIGLAERLLFRRGMWETPDLHPGLGGIQFWNGGTGRDFAQGMAFWIADLLAGNRRMPIAGNDAHGDLNRATQVRTPLVSLRQSKAHRFGYARTWIHLDHAPTRAGLRRALREGAPAVLSNGPALVLKAPGSRHQATRCDGADLVVEAASLPEFGRIDKIRVYAHVGSEPRETLVAELAPASMAAQERIGLPAQVRYVRAELRTLGGYRALTGAVEPG